MMRRRILEWNSPLPTLKPFGRCLGLWQEEEAAPVPSQRHVGFGQEGVAKELAQAEVMVAQGHPYWTWSQDVVDASPNRKRGSASRKGWGKMFLAIRKAFLASRVRVSTPSIWQWVNLVNLMPVVFCRVDEASVAVLRSSEHWCWMVQAACMWMQWTGDQNTCCVHSEPDLATLPQLPSAKAKQLTHLLASRRCEPRPLQWRLLTNCTKPFVKDCQSPILVGMQVSSHVCQYAAFNFIARKTKRRCHSLKHAFCYASARHRLRCSARPSTIRWWGIES